ncbi:retrotransposon protein, putative, ty1-copia subclass [Tanacetum coccineum]
MIIREVFVKLLLDSFGKLSISLYDSTLYVLLCYVLFITVIGFKGELHENTEDREILFLYCYAFSVSLLLTPLCCDDIHDVTPRASAFAGCDTIPRDGIFEIDLSNSYKNVSSMYALSNKRAKSNLDSALLWHCRLGHISKKRIEKLQHDRLLNSTNLRAFEKYVPCMSGKMARKPYTHQVDRAKDLLGLIHTDVCGAFKIVSRQGASYFVTFTDDFSRYGYVYLLKHKHEVFETFKVFQKEVENQLGKTIKSLHSDRGGEYMSQEFLDSNSHSRVYDYEIWQMDVKTAFLNGYLIKKVYMKQPKASGSNVTFLILYVDDILIMENNIPMLQDVKSYLRRCFAMKDLGEAAYILGIKIYRDRSRRLISLYQSAYIEKILKRFHMENSKRGSIPMQDKLRLSKSQDVLSLMNTKDMFLEFTETGYVFVLNGGAIDWKITKQSIFVTSSAEAEYIVTYDASKEAVWLVILFWAYVCARHFRAKVHYLCEVIEFGDIMLEKVHTDDNLVDPFTKSLAFPKNLEHTKNIGMLPRVVSCGLGATAMRLRAADGRRLCEV